MTEWRHQDFIISTDKHLLNKDLIVHFLQQKSYWAKNRKRETIEKSIEHSLLCFGLYKQHENGLKEQVGFARLVTDLTTFAYLCDVFIIEGYRGKGLSKWLVHVITNHPDLKDIRRILLVTLDAHLLYAKFGFTTLDYPQQFMQLIGEER